MRVRARSSTLFASLKACLVGVLPVPPKVFPKTTKCESGTVWRVSIKIWWQGKARQQNHHTIARRLYGLIDGCRYIPFFFLGHPHGNESFCHSFSGAGRRDEAHCFRPEGISPVREMPPKSRCCGRGRIFGVHRASCRVFQDEIPWPGIDSSPSFARAPKGSGSAERFIHIAWWGQARRSKRGRLKSSPLFCADCSLDRSYSTLAPSDMIPLWKGCRFSISIALEASPSDIEVETDAAGFVFHRLIPLPTGAEGIFHSRCDEAPVRAGRVARHRSSR